MRRYGPAILLLLTGAAILRISLFSELYLRYVQSGLRPYLVVSGAVLVLLGAAAGVVRWRGRHADEEYEEGHGHAHPGPRPAWLLALPALALLLFPPPALGSYSAGREAAQRAAQGVGTFPALPSGDPVRLTLAEFSSRAIYDSGRSLKGRTVRMTGFVTQDDDGTWYVTRLYVTCCAADATTSKIEIRGNASSGHPPTDAWVTVTGTWRPKGELGSDAAWPPVLDAGSVVRVKQPLDPYEKR
ncbi:TIGR03943 family protein [Streptomyces sp. DG2A-72]|uniref:TIGR03943 family putative permease subunit n=1 Tax=Streptomyces sp. DG2A-72 TaxID=3051386 RepID=UPI00265C4379|nr:TIGR03943 family protein [Streptomyces sp. DG2A-72]MDO0934779.1 TIGR03943 family protein [Streptomyces sp. DG2A-72]